jgi:hypothetical protein
MGESRPLFLETSHLPAGFRYREDLVDPAGEARLVDWLAKLDFAPFEFHGFLGRRRVVFFGSRYDFGGGGLRRADPIPAFLEPLRESAAAGFGLEPRAFEQVLLTEYTPGSTIGWHRDRPVFGDVIGVSLSSACRLRFRKKIGAGWERRSIVLEARSAYLLRGPARTDWEHSIPAVERLRYSITFRTLR